MPLSALQKAKSGRNFLAIDTSTERAAIALNCNDTLFVRTDDNLKHQAEWVLPTINELLTLASLSLQQLDGIVLGRGPGRFTGLRVACSVAKGLAFAANLKVFPVSSLLSIAVSLKHKKQNILAVMDARMQAWYWLFMNKNYRAREMLTSPEEVFLAKEGDVILAGVGFEELYEKLNPAVKERVIAVQQIYPSVENMINLVLQGKVNSVAAKDARPKYLRQKVI